MNIAGKEMKMQHFYCDDISEMKEYVGCKTDIKPDDKWMHFTQPVMVVQSFKDEFDIEDAMRRPPTSPGEPTTFLPVAKPDEYVPRIRLTYFRRGVGKLLHRYDAVE